MCIRDRCRTELTEVLCTGMDVVQNTQLSEVPGTSNAHEYIRALGGGARFEVEDFIQLEYGMFSLGQRPQGNP